MTPTEKQKFRAALAAWCLAAVENEPRVHYSQQRPFRYYGIRAIGHDFCVLDCSGFVGNVYRAAMLRSEVPFVHDPLGFTYKGIGNTGTSELYLRAHGKLIAGPKPAYWVGDIARYGTGNHAHMTVCTKNGSVVSAEWTSHGREAGPTVVKLRYRPDLVGVWRHPALL